MTSPFPTLKRPTFTSPAGFMGPGKATPPFLQARRPKLAGPSSAPVLTPKDATSPVSPVAAATPAGPVATPTPSQPVQIAQQAKPGPQTLYEFLRRDLEDKRNAAIASARADAAARGVFYGTPLTTSQGNIETEFQRGLGQLQAGLLEREQQNELQRLALAAQLYGGFGGAGGGEDNSAMMQLIGSLLAPRPGPVTPAQQRGNRTQSQ